MALVKIIAVLCFIAFASSVFAGGQPSNGWRKITTYSDDQCTTPIAVVAVRRYLDECLQKKRDITGLVACQTDVTGAVYTEQIDCGDVAPTVDLPIRASLYFTNDCSPSYGDLHLFVKYVSFSNVVYTYGLTGPDAYSAATLSVACDETTGSLAVAADFDGTPLLSANISAGQCSIRDELFSQDQTGCEAAPVAVPVAAPLEAPVAGPVAAPVAAPSTGPVAGPSAAPVRAPVKASSGLLLSAQLLTVAAVAAAVML